MTKKRRTRKQKERAKARRLQHISSITTEKVSQDGDSKQDISSVSNVVQDTKTRLEEKVTNQNINKIKFSIIVFISLISIQLILWVLLRLEMLPQSWIELLS
ncbi:MAG: hypothetical protein WDZ42_01500 [Candidatus Saccharimonadales bacterium]